MIYKFIKRAFDILFSLIGIVIFFLPLTAICIYIRLFSNGSFLHKAKRIGKKETPFIMLKIRTMRNDTPLLSIESIESPENFYLRFGNFIRKSGIDEIPQLYNILKGDMSFVGPRPTLFDPEELIKLRQEENIYSLRPGLTGYAQINGRSNISNQLKVKLDKYYLINKSFAMDMKILFKTLPSILLEFKPVKDTNKMLSAKKIV
ncbi:MAG: sugar transferase [Ignavibacteria bacterium]|nr:sugar transferase [Ignavibacteria bacterium]